MTGVPNRLPKLPKLVIEKVPPWTSSGLSCRDARARGQIHDGPLQAQHVHLVGVANHRHDQAVLERHGDADVDFVVVDDVRPVDGGVDDGDRRAAPRPRRAR